MNAAAPDGAPPRRIGEGKTALAPPCLGEALMLTNPHIFINFF